MLHPPKPSFSQAHNQPDIKGHIFSSLSLYVIPSCQHIQAVLQDLCFLNRTKWVISNLKNIMCNGNYKCSQLHSWRWLRPDTIIQTFVWLASWVSSIERYTTSLLQDSDCAPMQMQRAHASSTQKQACWLVYLNSGSVANHYNYGQLSPKI